MPPRLATDIEIQNWRDHGWVLLDGLVGTEEIDKAHDDLNLLFPTAEQYHSDPAGATRKWLGTKPDQEEEFIWPEDGPGFRGAQHRWNAPFPFPGSGSLNRLCVHSSIVDFAERALGTPDIRIYQTHANATYAGLTNYEQPMHIDRNHSWLPAGSAAPWWNLEGFLYLSDVTEADNPTRVVSVRDSSQVSATTPIVMPDTDPRLYESEHRSCGVRGSYLAYRSDVFHRGAPFGSSDGARFLLALAFKSSGQDWIGYQQAQSRSTDPEWTTFAEQSTPRDLELFGFPPPGHPIWSDAAPRGDCPSLSEARPRTVANGPLRLGASARQSAGPSGTASRPGSSIPPLPIDGSQAAAPNPCNVPGSPGVSIGDG